MKRVFRSLALVLAAAVAIIYWVASRPQIQLPTEDSVVQVDSTGARSGGQKASTEMKDRVAPDISVQTYSAANEKLSKFKGQMVVLNFWATWCQPCVEELPSLVKLAEYGKSKGFSVVAISVDENWELIDNLFKRLNLGAVKSSPLRVLRDVSGAGAEAFGTNQFPETFVIDRQFVIQKKYVGARDWMAKGSLDELAGMGVK